MSEEWENTETPCRKCKQVGTVVYRIETSSDEAFDDCHYHCSSCNADWWVDGCDS